MYGANSFDDKFITREELLKRVSQIQIMERYLGIRVQFNKSVKNPLRNDTTAGCRFYVKNGRIRFVDYSKGFNEDCFGVVQTQYGNCNFNEAIKQVAEDFNLYTTLTAEIPTIILDEEIITQEEKVKHTYLYEISADSKDNIIWRPEDKRYWKDHCLNSEILEGLDIYPLSSLYIDDNLVYTYRTGDIGFIYVFPDETFKAYFPYREKGKRFIGNSTYLQGYNHLPETGDILVITKAMKDVACLNLFNIPSVAPQSENVIMNSDILDDLDNRFNRIVVLFDFDLTGIRAAKRLYNQRGYDYLFFTTGKFNTIGYRAKDFSHYLLNNKKDKTLELIKNTYNEMI